jgi:hypothetical protein
MKEKNFYRVCQHFGTHYCLNVGSQCEFCHYRPHVSHWVNILHNDYRDIVNGKKNFVAVIDTGNYHIDDVFFFREYLPCARKVSGNIKKVCVSAILRKAAFKELSDYCILFLFPLV